MPVERLRIFISSPGDVAEERVLATNLVRRLADQCANRVSIEPVIWEAEPLLATATFQSQIPKPSECQIIVSILWSRLGTRLPANITRTDGSRYASGTEYEFEEAIDGFRRNGQPQLLVYRKTAEPVVSLRDEQDVLNRLQQRKGLDQFLHKWFFDAEDGSLKAAFHSFETSSQFEQLLEEHLRKLIERLVPEGVPLERKSPPSTWSGSPFRGLEVFEFEHAPIFFGRTKAVADVIQALRKQAADGQAFVLVTGASGSGKSSLARAGVLPLLTQRGVVQGVAGWRRAALRPSDAGGDVFLSLAQALLAPVGVPELSSGMTPQQLAKQLRNEPRSLAPLLQGALSLCSCTHLVLLVDQFEEVFTPGSVDDADRIAFTEALSVLARSGIAWVLATVRGDYYEQVLKLPFLVELMEGAGQYALLPPTPAEIGQMIRQPALAAGITFEHNPETGSLDEVLRDAAASDTESLPLLEFALDQLYQRRSAAGLLTYHANREIGGIEGALARRAEEVYLSLPADGQNAFSRVFRALVTVEGDRIARRTAALESFSAMEGARRLVDAFVLARLFSADSAPDYTGRVRIAHEALLAHWPRLAAWLESNREQLRARARVSAAATRWLGEGSSKDLLLPTGKALEEARALGKKWHRPLAPRRTFYPCFRQQSAAAITCSTRRSCRPRPANMWDGWVCPLRPSTKGNRQGHATKSGYQREQSSATTREDLYRRRCPATRRRRPVYGIALVFACCRYRHVLCVGKSIPNTCGHYPK